MSQLKPMAVILLMLISALIGYSLDRGDDDDEDKEKHDEGEEEINSIREAYGLPKKRKGPHGAKPKLNCRSVYSL